ncbi:MAG TPA: efflux transporter outer membrane subunit [Allosphingosinicella sp.]|nr:efflux transporter outer membrane subunit [Allosphingosinicella sp.]
MTRSFSIRSALLLSACGLAGCAPQVQLAEPQPISSAQWSVPVAASGLPTQPIAAMLGSSELAALVARAHAANPDLAVAAARIEQARAQLREVRAEALPVASASLGIGGSASGRGNSDAFDLRAGAAGLDISWEADLFGRLKAGRRAAAARVGAAASDRDGLALALEGEVARAYVQHATLGRRLALLDRNLASARELARIIDVRVRHGASTRVESGIQALEVRQLEVERSRLEEAASRTRNALAVLIGEEAPRFAGPTASLSGLAVPAVAVVQPGELLTRRPDVRAAEARIGAAAGDVAQARAAFLPQLRLSAGGLAEAVLGGPIAATASIGADLLAPIFNRGRLRGQLDFATATQRESVELYRGVLLQALREAEDALAGTEQSRRRADMLANIIAQARETSRLARLQYVEGVADLQTVIQAEERLIAVEDALALATQERLEAAIDLYRAMGGSAVPDTRFVNARR